MLTGFKIRFRKNKRRTNKGYKVIINKKIVSLYLKSKSCHRSCSFITSAVKDRSKKKSIIGKIIRINKIRISPFLYDEMDLKERNQIILIH